MIDHPIVRAALHWVPAVMLIVALGAWPYGYYMLLRVVVCIAAALLAFDIYRRAGEVTLGCTAFIAMAILFNPILPVHLTRTIWSFINLAGAALFVAHFFISRAKAESSSPP